MGVPREEFTDKTYTCVEQGCGKKFVWTRGEQSFMAQLDEEGKLTGGVIPPKRCPACRAKKKAAMQRTGGNRN